MKRVLAEDKSYPYLLKNASCRLEKARATSRNAKITSESLISLGGDMWCLFPWLGTYSFLALERFLTALPRFDLSAGRHTVTLVKGDVGLGNVDNTSDADKPVSTAQAAFRFRISRTFRRRLTTSL